jgi:transcriptional regulator with XRE-family HTH domain
MSQQEVCGILALVSTSRLSQWEHGVVMPSLPNLIKLCVLYQTTVEKVYTSQFNSAARKYDKNRNFIKKVYEPKVPVSVKGSQDERTDEELLAELADMVVDIYLSEKINQEESYS